MAVPTQLSQPSTMGDSLHQPVSLKRWEARSQWIVQQPESRHVKVLLDHQGPGEMSEWPSCVSLRSSRVLSPKTTKRKHVSVFFKVSKFMEEIYGIVFKNHR